MDARQLKTSDEIAWILRDKQLEELFEIFDKVNTKDTREACIEAINEKVLKPIAVDGEWEEDKELFTKASFWYMMNIEFLLSFLDTRGFHGFPLSESVTMLILVRGALKLDEEKRNRFKRQHTNRESKRINASIQTKGLPRRIEYDADKDAELKAWERTFSIPLVNAFCAWLSRTILLSGGLAHKASWKEKEQCFVVLRGALKREKRRYIACVRELFIDIIEKTDHSDVNSLPRELRSYEIRSNMEKILARIFKTISEVGDKNLLPAIERNAPTPEQVQKFAQMAIESNPEMRKEEARWLAINSLKAS